MKITSLILAMLLAFSISACGKKGPLEPPPPRGSFSQSDS